MSKILDITGFSPLLIFTKGKGDKMESIEKMAEMIPAETPAVVKDNDEVIKALYDVGAKISDVIVKMTEMSEKMKFDETEVTDETEVNDETDVETEITEKGGN